MSTAKGNGGFRNRVHLDHCLAVVVRKEGCRGDPGDFWMYENGYLLFQGLLSSNSVCWWNTGLNSATRSLQYHGYVSPGALLVSSEPCAVDVLKNAWARRVLQPPPGYQIVGLEDIDTCIATTVIQTQWTPLPDAVCAVILRLSRQGRPAGTETIREALILTFPHVSPPSEQALYDTLAQLTAERKLYHTSNGYFIVTPERRRSRSSSRGRNNGKRSDDNEGEPVSGKTMLMSTEEALVMVHGDMATIRDGDVTHQMIQTNLADVICGGNASDKILYARKHRRTSRSPDGRRGSFRLWRSTRRLRRSASTRTIAKHYDTTSSSTESSTPPTPKKGSLLSRLFRKTKKSQGHNQTFTAQFPPSEWFNSKAVHLHSIGTQTTIPEKDMSSATTYLENCELKASRSATLPRRRLRPLEIPLYPTSRDTSPLSRRHPSYNTCSLPRAAKQKSRESSRKTSRSSSLAKTNDPTTTTTTTTHVNNSNDNNSNATPSQIGPKVEPSVDNSGPSSIESHKSSTKTESSFASGPSSLESHKTVINTKEARPSPVAPSNSFTLKVTTNQGTSKLNNKPNTSTTTTINGEGGSNTKIFVQNSPVRSVITFENGRDERNSNLVIINDTEAKSTTKNTNQVTLNNSRDLLMMPAEVAGENAMNNSRKLSLQLPNKDGLSFHNLIKNVSAHHNQLDSAVTYSSTPPSPTKTSTDALSSIGNIYIKNEALMGDFGGGNKKNILGSEPNICCKDNREQFPSLNDLSFNFTSLAAQKILKGVGLNSVDTLVELNMSANVDSKPNNCDVVHTDFGMF